ncbi:MAG TPA: methylmalonyl Co-A mutase-associated GTPase MeaB, partial [Chloroflexota bacterium]
TDLRAMLQLSAERAWPPPIVQTVATEGTGISGLVDRIEEHRLYLERSGAWHTRRADSARRQVRAIVEDRVQRRFEQLTAGEAWQQRFASIAARERDPYSVAEEVLDAF